MKGLITILAVLLVLGVVFFLYRTPTAPPEMTEADRAQYEAEVRQEIEGQLHALTEAIVSENPQAVASIWTSDVVILEPGVSVEGAELLRHLEGVFENFHFTGHDATISDFFVHGGVAYTIGEYSVTMEVEGQETTAVNNYFTRWEKEDGVWKADRMVAGPRDAPGEG